MGCLPLSFEMNLRFHRHPVRMARISEALAALEACHRLHWVRVDEVAILVVVVVVMAEVALTVRPEVEVALWVVPWVRRVAVQA